MQSTLIFTQKLWGPQGWESLNHLIRQCLNFIFLNSADFMY